MSTIAIFGSYVLSRKDGAQDVLRDHWVLVEGKRIAAVTRDRPSADQVYDRPGRFVLPGLLNLHNHCFSEAVARSHTEDGNGRKHNQSIVYTVLLPLTKRGADILSPEERLAVARLGILQLLKGGATTVMEPFRNSIPEMFDAAEEMGIRFYGAPYLFSTSDAKAGADGVVHYAGDDGTADMATWDALYQRWNNRGDGRIGLAMSPHATDTCGPDLLRPAPCGRANSVFPSRRIWRRAAPRSRPSGSAMAAARRRNISIGSACLRRISWRRTACSAATTTSS